MLIVDTAALCRLIPHHGTMCLLDTVERWDDSSILCTAASHRDAMNRLRRDNELEAICGLEYAARQWQGMSGFWRRGRCADSRRGIWEQ